MAGLTPPAERRKSAPQDDKEKTKNQEQEKKGAELKPALKSPRRHQPPISATSYLPIYTVPLPPADTSSANTCPVCMGPLTNPTACQTGYVFCYVCIFHWLNGEHQRQVDFMDGQGAGAPWEDGIMGEDEEKDQDDEESLRRRSGKWESGKGRCPVTGRRVLGGTDGLRRVLI